MDQERETGWTKITRIIQHGQAHILEKGEQQ
jgi:hypothetical protein